MELFLWIILYRFYGVGCYLYNYAYFYGVLFGTNTLNRPVNELFFEKNELLNFIKNHEY